MVDAGGQQAILEALRQRAAMGASNAGIPGGMSSAMQPSPANPMAQQGIISTAQAPASTAMPQAGTAENPSAGSIAAMNGAQPGEAMFIVKALANRLKQHPVPAPGQ